MPAGRGKSGTRSRPVNREPIKPVCFASAPRQTLMLPGGSPPGIAPAASGSRGTHNRSRVGNPYPALGFLEFAHGSALIAVMSP